MAKYLGKEELIKALKDVNSKKDPMIKGLMAEVHVGSMLEKHLPSDCVIVAHPQIGKYDPDFIVISPRYGFRIIEVKSYDIASIHSVETNGTVIFLNRTKSNPMSQVKLHLDELRTYLENNHKVPQINMGCLVLHYGFTKGELNTKFGDKFSDNFNETTIFRDQLNGNLDGILEKAGKGIKAGLTKNLIDAIVGSIKIAEPKYQEQDQRKVFRVIAFMTAFLFLGIGLFAGINIINKTEDKKATSAEIDLYISDSSGDNSSTEADKDPENGSIDSDEINNGVTSIKTNTDSSITEKSDSKAKSEERSYVITSLINNFIVGETVEITCQVIEFNFDKETETKFIKLTDGESAIDGVIFKDRKGVPFITEGRQYILKGTLNTYKGEKQIIVDSLEEL